MTNQLAYDDVIELRRYINHTLKRHDFNNTIIEILDKNLMTNTVIQILDELGGLDEGNENNTKLIIRIFRRYLFLT